eukprot:PhM_4_TR1293/c0_g1_i3/m.14523/K10408/DNAH; dynein heavy chain, axonemal
MDIVLETITKSFPEATLKDRRDIEAFVKGDVTHTAVYVRVAFGEITTSLSPSSDVSAALIRHSPPGTPISSVKTPCVDFSIVLTPPPPLSECFDGVQVQKERSYDDDNTTAAARSVVPPLDLPLVQSTKSKSLFNSVSASAFVPGAKLDQAITPRRLDRCCTRTQAWMDNITLPQSPVFVFDEGLRTEGQAWQQILRFLTGLLNEIHAGDAQTVVTHASEHPMHHTFCANFTEFFAQVKARAAEARKAIVVLTSVSAHLAPFFGDDIIEMERSLPSLFEVLSQQWCSHHSYVGTMLPSFLRCFSNELAEAVLRHLATVCERPHDVLKSVCASERGHERRLRELLKEVTLCRSVMSTLRQQAGASAFATRVVLPDVFQRAALFATRIFKLEDVLLTVMEFTVARGCEFDGLKKPVKAFFNLLRDTIVRPSAQLNVFAGYTDVRFDHCYTEYCTQLEGLEASFVISMNSFLESFKSMQQTLIYVKKFQNVFQHRPRIAADLAAKYNLLLHTFSAELDRLYQYFEHNKDNVFTMCLGPPRDPAVPANTLWLGFLRQKAERPLYDFMHNPAINRTSKDFRKVARKYNKLGVALATSETALSSFWLGRTTTLHGILHGAVFSLTPVVRVQGAEAVLQIVHECKIMLRAGVALPEGLVTLVQHRHALLTSIDYLVEAVRGRAELEEVWELHAFPEEYVPVTFEPIVKNIDEQFSTAAVHWTWLTPNLPVAAAGLCSSLQFTRWRLFHAMDIIKNVIEASLLKVERTLLADWATVRPETNLERFVAVQVQHATTTGSLIVQKSEEIENAVSALLVMSDYDKETETFYTFMCERLGRAIYTNMLNSLRSIRVRLVRQATLFTLRAEAEYDGTVALTPSVEVVASNVGTIVETILRAPTRIKAWKWFPHLPHLLEQFGRSRAIVKESLWLSGASQKISKMITKSIQSYSASAAPHNIHAPKLKDVFTLEDLQEAITYFSDAIEELQMVSPCVMTGAILVDLTTVKEQLVAGIQPQRKVFCEGYATHYNIRLAGQLRVLLDISAAVAIPESTITLEDGQRIMKAVNRLYTLEHAHHELLRECTILVEHLRDAATHDPTIESCAMSVNRTKDELIQTWERVGRTAEASKNEVRAMYMHLLAEFRRHQLRFRVSELCFRNLFVTSLPLDLGNVEEFFERLSHLEQHTEALVTSKAENNVAETFFGVEHSSHPELNATELDVLTLSPLHDLYRRQKLLIDGVHSILWRNMTQQRADEELDRVDELIAISQTFSDETKSYTVYGLLTDRIREFRFQLSALGKLTAKFLRDRHFAQLAKMDSLWPSDLKTATVGQMCAVPMDKYSGYIDDIIAVAKGEELVEQTKTEISNMWADRAVRFDMTRWELVVPSVTPVVSDLDDAKQSLTNMLNDSSSFPFRDELTKMLQLLTAAKDMLLLLLEVQSLWQFVSAVFTADTDLSRDLPEESKRFSVADKAWRMMMRSASQDDVVIRLCRNPDVLSTLPGLGTQLQNCRKQLLSYLSRKCDVFPRLHYISQAALMEIIASCGSNPSQIVRFLPLIFGPMTTLKFTTIERHGHQDNASSMSGSKKHNRPRVIIEAYGSAEGEVVRLKTPVECSAAVEEWLQALHRESKQTLSSLITDSFQNTPPLENWDAATLVSFVSQFPRQVCGVHLKVQITRLQNEMLYPSQNNRSARRIGLRSGQTSLSDLRKHVVDQLRGIEEGTTPSKRHTLEYISSLIGDALETHIEFARRRPVDPTSMLWLETMRYQHDRDKATTAVQFLDAAYEYGNEYHGTGERLVPNPALVRNFIGISQVLTGFCGGLVHGVGTQSTAAVTEFACLLGRMCFVFDIDRFVLESRLTKAITGSATMGDWMMLLCLTALTPQSVSSLCHRVHHLHRQLYKHSRSTTMDIDGEQVKVNLNHKFAIFTTLAPGDKPASHHLWQRAFRPIALFAPDTRVLARCTLMRHGYTTSVALGDKLCGLLQRCDTSLPRRIEYDFGHQCLQRILCRLPVASESDSHNEKAVASIAYQYLHALVHIDDVALLNEFFHSIFPTCESPQPDTTEIELACMPMRLSTPPTFITKCLTFQECVRSDCRGIIVFGTWECGKSTVLDVVSKTLPHRQATVYPSCLSLAEMYGYLHVSGVEETWYSGVLTRAIRESVSIEDKMSWIVCDGVLSDAWVHPLRLAVEHGFLCLSGREKVAVPNTIQLIIETSDAMCISPTLLTRFLIVHVDEDTVEWTAIATRTMREMLPISFKKEIVRTLCEFIRDNLDTVHREANNSNISLLHFSTTVARALRVLLVNSDRSKITYDDLEKVFWYAIAWVVYSTNPKDDAAAATERVLARVCPVKFASSPLRMKFDPKLFTLTPFEDPISLDDVNRLDNSGGETKIIVRTLQMRQCEFWLHMCTNALQPIIVYGPLGCGKRTVARRYLEKEHPHKLLTWGCVNSICNFTQSLQTITERRVGNQICPQIGSSRLVLMVEDMNIDDTVATSLLRHISQCSYLYPPNEDATTGIPDLVHLHNITLVMTAERCPQARALQNCLPFAMRETDVTTLRYILHRLLEPPSFLSEVNYIVPTLLSLVATLRSTIASLHLSPLTVVTQVARGLLLAGSSILSDTEVAMLLRHELARTVIDPVETLGEKAELRRVINVGDDGHETLFSTCTSSDGAYDVVRNPVSDISDYFEEYRMRATYSTTELVMFPQLCANVLKVHRLLALRRHAVLVGSSYSGKHNIVRLAAHIASATLFELSRDESDISTWLWEAVLEASHTDVVICMSTESKYLNVEEAISTIHTLISTYDFPGLYTEERSQELVDKIKRDHFVTKNALEDLAMWSNFVRKAVEERLTVVMCTRPNSTALSYVKHSFPSFFHSFSRLTLEDWNSEAFAGVIAAECSLPDPIVDVLSRLHVAMLEEANSYSLQHLRVCFCTIEKAYNRARDSLQSEKNMYEKALQALDNARQFIAENDKHRKNFHDDIKELEADVARLETDMFGAKATLAEHQRQFTQSQNELETTSQEYYRERELASGDTRALTARAEEALACLRIAKKGDWEALRIARNPTMVVREFFDCGQLLLHMPLHAPALYVMDNKFRQYRIEPSWDLSRNLLSDPEFPRVFEDFTTASSMQINDETIELMAPYQKQRHMQDKTIERTSKSGAALLRWLNSLISLRSHYHKLSPNLRRLEHYEGEYRKVQLAHNHLQAKIEAGEAHQKSLQETIEHKNRLRDHLHEANVARQKQVDTLQQALRVLDRHAQSAWKKRIAEIDDTLETLLGDLTVAAVSGMYVLRLEPETQAKIVENYLVKPLHAADVGLSPAGKSAWVQSLFGEKWRCDVLLSGLPKHAIELAATIKLVLPELENDDSRAWKIIFVDPQDLSKVFLSALGIGPRRVRVVPTTAALEVKFMSSANVLFQIFWADTSAACLEAILHEENSRRRTDHTQRYLDLVQMQLTLYEQEHELVGTVAGGLTLGGVLEEDTIDTAVNTASWVEDLYAREYKTMESFRRSDEEMSDYDPLVRCAMTLYRCTREVKARINSAYNVTWQRFESCMRQSLVNTPKDPLLARRVKAAAQIMRADVLALVHRGAFRRDHDLISIYFALQLTFETAGIPPRHVKLFVHLLNKAQKCSEPLNATDAMTAAAHLQEEIPSFRNAVTRIQQTRETEWKVWLEHPSPEEFALPGNLVASAFERLLFIAATRPDRALPALVAFADGEVPRKGFWENDIRNVCQDSTPWNPILLLLDLDDPTTDPQRIVERYAKANKKTLNIIHGINPNDAMYTDGHWGYLAFCESLSPEVMHDLLIALPYWESHPETVHAEVRLWLTTSVSKPVNALLEHRSVRLVAQAPSGVRAAAMYSRSLAITPEDRRAFSRPEWHHCLNVIVVLHSFLQGSTRRHGALGFQTAPLLLSHDTIRHTVESLHNIFLMFGDDLRHAVSWGPILEACSAALFDVTMTQKDMRMLGAMLGEMIVPPESLNQMWRPYVDGEATHDYPTMLVCTPHRAFSMTEQPLAHVVQILAGQKLKSTKKRSCGECQERMSALFKELPQLPMTLKFSARRLPADRVRFFQQELRMLHICVNQVRSDLATWITQASRRCLAQETIDTILDGLTPKAWKKVSRCQADGLMPWLRHLHRQCEQMNSDSAPSVHWLGGYYFPRVLIMCLVGSLDVTIEVLKSVPSEGHPPNGVMLVSGVHLVGAVWQRAQQRLRLCTPGEETVREFGVVSISRYRTPSPSHHGGGSHAAVMMTACEVPCYHHCDRHSDGALCSFTVQSEGIQQHMCDLHGIQMLLNPY